MKQAVRSKRTSERCERTSERTSELPSTYVSILVCSRPQCTGVDAVARPFSMEEETEESVDNDKTGDVEDDDGGGVAVEQGVMGCNNEEEVEDESSIEPRIDAEGKPEGQENKEK